MQTAPLPDRDGGLPRALGDGLVLRWATVDDTEAVADLNARVFTEDADRTRQWTYLLMRGDHPTTVAGDFTVVVDEAAGGRIVSTMCLIAQTWAYDGIPFGLGRPELVATLPDYRRRGLVRAQFAAVHARSAARGDLALAISGIPWYYRQFGYEMALNAGGTRRWHWFRMPEPPPDQPAAYRTRLATEADLPTLTMLYAVQRAESMVALVRDAAVWHYELAVRPAGAYGYRQFTLVEDRSGAAVGYYAAAVDERNRIIHLDELAVTPGHPWTPVCVFVGQAVRAQAETLNTGRERPLISAVLELGSDHPAYTALGSPPLEMYLPTYAWYLRVPDLPAFLRHIAPALERRLAGSVLVGYSGRLRLNLYRQHLALTFTDGRLSEIGPYAPKDVADGDAAFPDLTFLHLLFGHRSLADLRYAFPDCLVRSPETAVLLDILFPRRSSNPGGLV